LDPAGGQRQALQQGTLKIMQKLAEQLPDEYRGFYRSGEIDDILGKEDY
jgi:hypothetical protein